jgi:hypothetical protein
VSSSATLTEEPAWVYRESLLPFGAGGERRRLLAVVAWQEA